MGYRRVCGGYTVLILQRSHIVNWASCHSVLMVPFFLEKELCFPGNYPVGCLLGCVDMIDCLSQEEYQEQVCVPTLNTFMYLHSQTPLFLFFCLHGSGRTEERKKKKKRKEKKGKQTGKTWEYLSHEWRKVDVKWTWGRGVHIQITY